MTKSFYKDAFGWGFLLWLIGYVLGIILFMFVSINLLGWVIMPICTALSILVLWKKVNGDSLKYYLLVGIVWALIAIVFDYLFLVKLFNPADGYYKLDVYIYYIFAFGLPLIIGWVKLNKTRKK